MSETSSDAKPNMMRCPKCGGTNIKLIAEHRDDPGSFLGRVNEPVVTLVYACKCGMAFTKTRSNDK
jgi:hypothetical protein